MPANVAISAYRSTAASMSSPASDAVPRLRATIPSSASRIAQRITRPPPTSGLPTANAAAPAMLQASDALVSWFGVTPRDSAARSRGEKHQ